MQNFHELKVFFAFILLLGFAGQIVYSQPMTGESSLAKSATAQARTEFVTNPPGPDCAGPTSKVKVTIKQTGTSYTFALTNSSKYNLNYFAIGYDSSWIDDYNPDTYPKNVKSPKNWGGDVYEADFGGVMGVFWATEQTSISPGATLGGFTVEMPAAYDLIKQLPFEVRYFTNMKMACFWGRPVGATAAGLKAAQKKLADEQAKRDQAIIEGSAK